MEMLKLELDAVRETVDATEDVISVLADLQLAIVGGGTTDVTFH